MQKLQAKFATALTLGGARKKSRNYADVDGTPNPLSPRTLAADRKSKEEILNSLPPVYFEGDFDAGLHELKQLPPTFDDSYIEAKTEDRTVVLEVVSELLSAHVLQNYDKFVEGINEVGDIERTLKGAVAQTRESRKDLAGALEEVSCNIRIAQQTKRKQALVRLLEVLLKLQQTDTLRAARREAQENGEYAEAFWICTQTCKLIEDLSTFKVAEALTISVNKMYEETLQRLEMALTAVCHDFQPQQYSKVLEGYMFLGSVGQLGEEVKTCFTNVINSVVLRVVRGIVLARSGFAERAEQLSTLQDIVKCLASDLFRTCLTRVLMVIFDILVSHHTMVKWHEACLDQHVAEVLRLETNLKQLTGQNLSELLTSTSAEPHANGSDQLLATEQLSTSSSEAQAIESKLREELQWGEVLRTVHGGLIGGRKLLWDEAARKIGILLSSPAAFEGEHFLQVLEWTKRIVSAGEAFSGTEASGLRISLQKQSGNFFKAFHTSNMEALKSMLDKELWKRLPAIPGGLPSLREALCNPSYSESHAPGDGSMVSFDAWAAAGNPWRKGETKKHKRKENQPRLGFSGSVSLMDDDRATRLLEVDDYGLPRRVSTEPNSPGGSIRQVTDESEANHAYPIAEEDEPEEVYGDAIDEDSQQVMLRSQNVDLASTSSHMDSDFPTMTNASWRMVKWMKDYGELMRVLRTASTTVYGGVCELFELYLLHTFCTFSGISVQDIHASAMNPQLVLGQRDAVTPRLKSTLERIVLESLSKYKSIVPPPSTIAAVRPNIAAATPVPSLEASPEKMPSSSSAFQRFKEKAAAGMSLRFANNATHSASAEHAPGVHEGTGSMEPTVISNAGNLFGLQERAVAVESLSAVANELKKARGALQALLPTAEYAALDTFYQRTVAATVDVRDSILRTGARLNLPLRWVPERIATQNYMLAEPPFKHQPWVDELLANVDVFKHRLAQVANLGQDSIQQLWDHSCAYIAELVLDGISRVKKCTLEGRAGMSVDLQAVSHGLARLAPKETHINLRLVDTYIKGYYIPPAEFSHWAQTHPEYTHEQVMALIGCIAESSGMKRKDKNTLLQQIEENLKALNVGPNMIR